MRRRREPEPEAPPQIRMRYVETVMVPANELVPHDLNWKNHTDGQRNGLNAMLREIGFADVLLGRRLEDGTIQLVDGHLRKDMMGAQPVPVVILDLDDAEARKLLITLDPLAAMSEGDSVALKALMDQVQTADEEVANLITEIGQAFEVIPHPEPEAKPKGRSEKTIECPSCGYSFSSK
jgi:hypothetical protein